MFPDPAELMRRGEAGNNRMIANDAVPREASVIGKNDVITKLAVVRDVRIAEKQIVRADPSRQLLMGTAMYRAVFTEHIVIANLKGGWLTNVFQILSLAAHHRIWEKLV